MPLRPCHPAKIRLCLHSWVASVALAAPLQAASTPNARAEEMARQAIGQCQSGAAAGGEALARKALALTDEFEPTDYVRAGRKGEVVEDAFLDARRQYRAHRALLYDAVGACLAGSGRHRAASRYLGRAALLAPGPGRSIALARALVADGRAAESLAALRQATARTGSSLGPEGLRILEQAADGARLASAQVMLDRWRVEALKAPNTAHVTGPVRLAAGARLSTGAPFALAEEPVVLYMAPTSCRDCSAHLQEIQAMLAAYGRRAALDGGPDIRVLLLPEDPEQDQALRRVVALYRYDWPVLLGRGHAEALGTRPGRVRVVARSGWSAVDVQPPFDQALGQVLDALARRDLGETVPRSSWNRQAAAEPAAAAPALLPEGLAPGEDAPPPAAFTAALESLRAGRPLEALRFMDALAADPQGWLLPPEARFNRAILLRAAGDREAARRILLRIGDSRFQGEVDKALEAQPSR